MGTSRRGMDRSRSRLIALASISPMAGAEGCGLQGDARHCPLPSRGRRSPGLPGSGAASQAGLSRRPEPAAPSGKVHLLQGSRRPHFPLSCLATLPFSGEEGERTAGPSQCRMCQPGRGLHARSDARAGRGSESGPARTGAAQGARDAPPGWGTLEKRAGAAVPGGREPTAAPGSADAADAAAGAKGSCRRSAPSIPTGCPGPAASALLRPAPSSHLALPGCIEGGASRGWGCFPRLGAVPAAWLPRAGPQGIPTHCH